MCWRFRGISQQKQLCVTWSVKCGPKLSKLLQFCRGLWLGSSMQQKVMKMRQKKNILTMTWERAQKTPNHQVKFRLDGSFGYYRNARCKIFRAYWHLILRGLWGALISINGGKMPHNFFFSLTIILLLFTTQSFPHVVSQKQNVN